MVADKESVERYIQRELAAQQGRYEEEIRRLLAQNEHANPGGEGPIPLTPVSHYLQQEPRPMEDAGSSHLGGGSLPARPGPVAAPRNV